MKNKVAYFLLLLFSLPFVLFLFLNTREEEESDGHVFFFVIILILHILRSLSVYKHTKRKR